MIVPLFDYIALIVQSSLQKCIKRLQPLQNRAIRTILCKRGYISTPEMKGYHKILGLHYLENRRKFFMAKMIYKLSKDTRNLDDYRPGLELRAHPKVKMKVPFTKKNRVLNSPYYLCVRIWDQLPVDIQRAPSIMGFINKVKQIDFTSYKIYV